MGEKTKDKEIKMENRDYSNSAVNLCNPDEVKSRLRDLLLLRTELEALEKDAESYVPEEIRSTISNTEEAITTTTKELKELIDEHGSYQDVEAGEYAVKQVKISKVYHTEPFKEHYEKYTPAVIVESVNVKALEGLVKGKLIEEADLKMYGVFTEDITYAYILK